MDCENQMVIRMMTTLQSQNQRANVENQAEILVGRKVEKEAHSKR